MKGKIINDPIYGFLRFHDPTLLKVLDHPLFQRLRRIKQMGMAHYVYPGAIHTRFHHSLGACHLMGNALNVLKSKGIYLSDKTYHAAQIAILLHDIGHGPFSHSLEHSIVKDISHEEISLQFMLKLNEIFDGKLSEAIDIFKRTHRTTFLSQLVSGQLDMDRMDYLNRDSFYSGVSEGVIGYDRILQMLDVHEGNIVVEEKGIHSVEKFLIARRLMYWQVYLHKTVLGTEQLLIKVLQRAKYLAKQGVELFASPSYKFFLYNDISKSDFLSQKEPLEMFADLDDSDISVSIKTWAYHHDHILSTLCKMITDRKLFKVNIRTHNLQEVYHQFITDQLQNGKYSAEELQYYSIQGETGNDTYNNKGNINILFKDGHTEDISNINNTLITKDIAKPIIKSYIGIIPSLSEDLNKYL